MLIAEHIALERYGLRATARALAGEKDLNFHLTTANGEFVLKLSEPIAPSHAERVRATLAMQDAAIHHAAERVQNVAMQRVVPALSGGTITSLDTSESEGARFVRLLTYLPGRLWANCNPRTPEMLRSLGQALGEVDAALASFAHPAVYRDLKWDLAKATWIRDHVQRIESAEQRAIIEKWLNEYQTCIQPKLASLRQQVIYNDANDYNIIVLDPHPQPLSPWEREVGIGLIDFGDVLHSALICDLAIACAYVMLNEPDPLSAAKEVVTGFHETYPLQAAELEVLFPLIAMRLCVSVVNSAWQRAIAPDNGYLQVSALPAWDLLVKLETIHPNLAHYTFRAACGLPAAPHSPSVVQWLKDHADEIGFVVLPDLKTCPKIHSDWSVGSLELGSPDEYADAEQFTRKIWARMAEAGVKVAIGGYNHARPVYGGEAFRIPSPNGYEWRTVHIGLDVFMDAGTPIYAPLDGVVHSFAFNDAKYDYGPCVVLEHKLRKAEGVAFLSFYTLYGHLTLDSLDSLYEGKPIRKGEAFAKIGPYPVNGDWPPHLHLQLICDMLDKCGDFDGSCRPSQRDVWLSLCPDPNLITGMPDLAPSPLGGERNVLEAKRRGGRDEGGKRTDELLSSRRDLIGYNLSISYKKKLHIVRGWKQWLYDADGQRYLDGVNNVAHVGHCHPRVVRAGQRQMAVLNTNTRYLHELLTEYARRLTATLPEPLKVCFFVNSGSEANELALRLARAHTRQKDMLVVDVGYHGNTTSIVDISPYKHNHTGGMGAPDWVHMAEMPDVYRGRFGADDLQAGAKYAIHLGALIEGINRLPPHYQSPRADVRWMPQRGPAAFICEGILSCGGQIVLPSGYLREAYRIVRDAGGACIADEVQTGFGRVGTHFWAFETQGVVPDIVTMGKPMGNGHPLGAVVTTSEIAASFNNGLEYFNTFGGNPVSCAIGLAVLDVIADEGLQAQALHVGNYLMAGLRGLQQQHAIIGDVRGLGLFCGFELVRDRATKTPATEEASYLVNRVKEHGILLSTDGPFENVIKIKPPLCFDEANANSMLATLDKVLREDGIRV